MGSFHKNLAPYLENIKFDNDDIIVEIGSERGEGSTAWFDNLAGNFGTKLYSVDVVEDAKRELSHLTNTEFIVAESGSLWAHEDLPKLGKKIKILYLDNYDWLGSMHEIRTHERRQIEEYMTRGVFMSNLDCQREHLHQMVGCLPFMHEASLIVCDDTPYQEHSGIYIGKNGAVIPYLLSYGYEIIFGRGLDRQCNEDNGVILSRG